MNIDQNLVNEIRLGSKCNSVVVMNPSPNTTIYMSLSRNLSTAEYQAIALPGSLAVIARPFEFETLYLFATADIARVTLSEIYAENPLMLVSQMISQSPIPQNINVMATVGLKAADLDFKPGSGTLIVSVEDLPELPAGTKKIGKVDVDSIPEIESVSWLWKKVTAAVAGDIVVKATPGKVACLIADNGVTIQLKDGANEAWKSGDYTGPVPIACSASIVVNFAAAGDAWILYR